MGRRRISWNAGIIRPRISTAEWNQRLSFDLRGDSIWASSCLISCMIQLCLRLRAESHKTPSIVKALRSVSMDAQLERGFLSSRIYQEVNDPDALCMEQAWSSAAALESHFRSSCFTRVLQIMEAAPDAPVLEVHAISAVQGLEYIEQVRFGER